MDNAARSSNKSSTDPASSASEELEKRWQEFAAYIGDYDHNQDQTLALLQLAVKTAEPGSAKKSARLEWPNIYAAVATLTRTDSETLHARLTIGFSPVEFKWMLQNKALYTWHSNPVRFQRCLQCMVAKLGQCGSNAEKTCRSCRSRLTDASPGTSPSSGNSLRPPRHIALTMAKTATKQPISEPEPDAHISMYEQSKWPLTKRDQTYLSQANKFWSFISTDAFLGITDRRQLLDLTDRACTKRYILYMHKMNKRENVRAAVDLHCLGLTYPQLHAAQSLLMAESDQSRESMSSEACHIPGPEAAGHLVPETLAGQQVSAEAASLSRGHESPSETPTARRSARVRTAFGAADGQPHFDQSSSAGKHDWVNPPEDLLVTLRGELDLDLRDAPDDSDEGGSRGGAIASPVRKCRPWHWLKEMRLFGYERQVMPKDQKKKRMRAGVSAVSSQSAPVELLRRQSSRRRAQQPGADSESSNENSAAADLDESGEEEDLLPEPKRRQRPFRVAARQPLRSSAHSTPSEDPIQDRDPPAIPSSNPSQLWGGSRSGVPTRVRVSSQDSTPATAAEALTSGLGLCPGFFGPGGQFGILDPRQGTEHTQSRALPASQLDRVGARAAPSGPAGVRAAPSGPAGAGAAPSGPAGVEASLGLPFPLPFASSRASSSLLGSSSVLGSSRSAFSLDIDLPPPLGSLQATGDSLEQHYFPEAHGALGGARFTHAGPTSGPQRQPWPPLNQGVQASPFGLPEPHHPAAHPTFSRGGSLGFSQGPQSLSLFHTNEDSQLPANIFDRARLQCEQDEYPIGQLEQHYLTHRHGSGPPRDVGPGGVPGLTGGSYSGGGSWGRGQAQAQAPFFLNPLGFMNVEQQQLLQHQHQQMSFGNSGNIPSSSLERNAAEYEPISQGTMNLDQLSALMQAERSQALPGLQSQPPPTIAQSFLTSMRMVSPFNGFAPAPPADPDSYPPHGESFHRQASAYFPWESRQGQIETMQRSFDHGPSPAEVQAAQIRASSQMRDPNLQVNRLPFSGHRPS